MDKRTVFAGTTILLIALLPFVYKHYTAWLSMLFGLLYLAIIFVLNRSRTFDSGNMKLVLALFMLSFPFIISMLTLFRYEDMWANWYSGLLAIDMSLIFLQYFITIPFTVIKPRKHESHTRMTHSVSIIVPAYNEEKWILRTLESLTEIDYGDKEIIVVDDGSTDNTRLKATSYARDNLGVRVYHKANGGKASAINYGLLYARGDIIVIVDADGLVSRDSLHEIVGLFSDPRVVGVAGNIKVFNKSNWLAMCQSLEYVVGINLYRKATAFFGIVEVLPGPLSAFRRSAVERVGRFDSDTLVEDADFTKKILKTGHVLQTSAYAFAYTEVPESLGGFVRQRTRWYRGNIQTFLKHNGILDFSKNIVLSSILFPLTFFNVFIQPWLGLVSLAAFVFVLVNRDFWVLYQFSSVFLILQTLITLIAIDSGDEDLRHVLYSPFLIIGYKHIIDLIKVKSLIEHFFRRKTEWNKLERKGPKIQIS